MKNLIHLSERALLALFFVVLFMCTAIAQPEYKLHITGIQIPEEKEATWYGRPTHCDFIVSWDLYIMRDDGKLDLVDSVEVLNYTVHISQEDSTFSQTQAKDVIGESSAIFTDNPVNKRFYFRLDGLSDGNVVVESDTAWAIGGRPRLMAQIEAPEGEEKGNFPIPLFFPLAELIDIIFHAENDIYAHSSHFGKASFTFVWYFFILGIIIVFTRCIPRLSLGRLFPFSKMSLWQSIIRKDAHYELCLSPRFRFFIEAWKRVIAKSHNITENKKATNTNAIEQLHFEHFNKYGLPALEALRKLVYFKFNPAESNNTNLVEDIKKHFGPETEFGDLTTGNFSENNPCINGALTWGVVEQELYDQKSKPLIEYPTAKILLAGLQNHLINGYSWQNVSQEVDRAVENRANSEIENLREQSSLEWLWNLGAMAPLLGLFGTVTGISRVFLNIKSLGTDVTQAEMVNKLSEGIFEALYTTIYGLIVGIILMLIYYYFKNNLEWIKNKWQSIYVHITEKL